MTMHQKTRLHDLRLKHGLGLAMTPAEHQEMSSLQEQEYVERYETIGYADSEFAAFAMR